MIQDGHGVAYLEGEFIGLLLYDETYQNRSEGG